MSLILEKKVLAPSIYEFVLEAPDVARKAEAGQFVVLRINEKGERIPLTIADYDRRAGTITIVFQEVGKTTKQLGQLKKGDTITNFIGPLGKPSPVMEKGTVVCIGGGMGIAPIYPIAAALKNKGNRVVSIIGARNRELLIWEERMRKVSDELHITTDDGSYGRQGFVSDELRDLMDKVSKIDLVFAIGPVVMMRAVCEVTRPCKLKTLVSLNPIMVDATGMCGCCRVSVGEETKFACVDGPDFDGHKVNFEELIARQRIYLKEEKIAMERCSCSENERVA